MTKFNKASHAVAFLYPQTAEEIDTQAELEAAA